MCYRTKVTDQTELTVNLEPLRKTGPILSLWSVGNVKIILRRFLPRKPDFEWRKEKEKKLLTASKQVACDFSRSSQMIAVGQIDPDTLFSNVLD